MKAAKEWIISDTHFHHANIIKYCNRPFATVYEMNEYMITAWNSVVSDNDIVYHLGDFGFGNSDNLKSVISRLNGDIILIRGNHDRMSYTKTIECGFTEFHKKSLQQGNLIFTHKPMESVPYDMINVHGHIHNVYFKQFDTDYHFNVSADVLDFKPISLDSI